MVKLVQEKFQVILEPQDEPNDWADFRTQRRISATFDTTEAIGIPNMAHSAEAPTYMQMSHNNEMPSGYSATGQHGDVTNFAPTRMAGQSDPTDHVTSESMARGYFVDQISQEQFQNNIEADFNRDMGGVVDRADYLERE